MPSMSRQAQERLSRFTEQIGNVMNSNEIDDDQLHRSLEKRLKQKMLPQSIRLRANLRHQFALAALAGTWCLIMPTAKAMNGPSSMTINAGPIGNLELTGGIDGFMYALSGTGDSANAGLLGTKSAGAEFMNGLIKVEKTTGLIRFTLQGGATTPFTLGTPPTAATVQAFPTGPLYAEADHAIGLDKFSSNFGAALFADYQFGTSPYSVGGWAEYFSSNGPDLWFVNPGAKGIEVSDTPTWQSGHLFARADLGILHLTDVGTGSGYGANGTDRNQATGVIEAGLLF